MLFLLIISCVLSGIAGDQTMHFDQYNHGNYWARPPEVILCTSQTHFSVAEVEQAIERWKREVSGISLKNNCDYDLERGKIKIVDGAFLKPDQWGYTSYIYVDRYRNGALVRQHKAALVQLDYHVDDIGSFDS